jgi:hypothetical protein
MKTKVMKYDWYSSDEDNKKVRRDAANTFLSDVLDDPNGLGKVVTGLEAEKRIVARAEFDLRLQKTANGGELPPDVEVICIEADTRKMANLIVFVLHKKGAVIREPADQQATPPSDELWRKRWVAAWAPY